MTKRYNSWVCTCKRFIAFMDIVGFEDMIFRKSHHEVRENLELFQSVIAGLPPRAPNLFGNTIVNRVFFSDSILLVSSDDSLGSAEHLLYIVEWVLSEAILKGIPMKAAIAYGEQTADFDRSLHFGRPLIDAYKLQDELLLYGAVLHHTMEQHLINNKIMQGMEDVHIFKYPTPFKEGKITHYVVDWPAFLDVNRDLQSILSRLYGTVSGPPRRYVDNTVDLVHWLAKKKKT